MFENMVGKPSSGDLLCIVNDLTGNETELEIVSLAGPFHQVRMIFTLIVIIFITIIIITRPRPAGPRWIVRVMLSSDGKLL